MSCPIIKTICLHGKPNFAHPAHFSLFDVFPSLDYAPSTKEFPVTRRKTVKSKSLTAGLAQRKLECPFRKWYTLHEKY